MSSITFGLPQNTCYEPVSKATKSTQAYYTVTLGTCVVTAVLAPMTVAANAFILAAIWKNPSLRTPSYVLLAGLAVTDLFTGLLTQPVYVVTTVSELTGNRKLSCIANQVAAALVNYFSTLTGFVIVLISVERWLHMSRRSLLTVRRVVIVYILFALLLLIATVGGMLGWYFWNNFTRSDFFSKLMHIIRSLQAICVVIPVVAYFKVTQIIRHRQRQVQINLSNVDMWKYRKSLFTTLYIFAIFILGYLPILCCTFALDFLLEYGETFLVAYNVSITLLFSSSFFNPLLYFWRIKEIRGSVRGNLKTLFCNQS